MPTSMPQHQSEPKQISLQQIDDRPPIAHRQNVVDIIHGQKVNDPFRWLEDATSDKTQTWLAAEDAYARKHLARLPDREVLEQRLKELSYIEWIGAPIRRGKRYFFTRRDPHQEKIVHYWRTGLKGKPRVLIDPNTLSKDGSIALRGVYISYDGKWAAYKLSQNAADMSTLYVMGVESGNISALDTIEGARYAMPSWTPQSDGFYYTRLPISKDIPIAELPGHAAIYFHRLGQDPKNDQLIHPKTGDPRTFINAQLSRDGRFLFVFIDHGWSRTDVYYRDLHDHDSMGFKPFMVGIEALFNVYAWKGKIYVQTNDGAPNYRLFQVDPRHIDRKQWKEIVPEQKDAVLDDFDVVGDHLALHYLRRATTEIEITTLQGKKVRRIAFPEMGSASPLSGNPEDDMAYFSFSSFTRPSTIYQTSIRRGGEKVYFKQQVPLDPSPYKVEQILYPSRDGTEISMFIIHRKDMPLDGSTPFLLNGYGGFNVTLTPNFSAPKFLWLEQGGGLAIPNLRGGGEYGESWHQAGMLLHKQNTFDDFIAAAEFLIKQKYTSSAKLAIVGGSNGGLLVGAAMVQRPDLFRAVVCLVPLLDMVRYHLFGSGKTWISEYGSADDPNQFRTLYAYSPYHHIKENIPYPAMLMMSADSDDRVDPMHARKFTAALRYANTSVHPILLRVETKAGHGGGDLIKKVVAANADEFAFLLHELGMKPRKVENQQTSEG